MAPFFCFVPSTTSGIPYLAVEQRPLQRRHGLQPPCFCSCSDLPASWVKDMTTDFANVTLGSLPVQHSRLMATSLHGEQAKLANEGLTHLGTGQACHSQSLHGHHQKDLAAIGHSPGNLDDIIGQLDPETDAATYASLLRRCTIERACLEGERVHEHMIRGGNVGNGFLNNLLVQMYGKCGSLQHARAVFESMVNRNSYSWNIMLVACAQNGRLDDARAVFAKMVNRDVVSWNAMIAACAQNGHSIEALQLFDQMHREGFEPNKITLLSALDACARVAALKDGRDIHANVVGNGWESDVVVGTALINMYGKSRSPDDAKVVFVDMPERNVISWNAMITICAQNARGEEALQHFNHMQAEGFEPNEVTLICILDACASMAALEEGYEYHALVVGNGWEADVVLGNALVNMYSKCGRLDDARVVFAEISQRDVVSWSAMISACAQNRCSNEAFELFNQMQAEDIQPDEITFISLLDACANVTALEKGREIHASLVGNGWESDVVVGNAIINMYGKCSSLDDARAVFVEMSQRDVVVWSAMIGVCAQNGHSKEAVQLYKQMQAEGYKPDKITFICILDACTNLAALEEGREIHASIVANGWECDVVVGTALINMYGTHESPDDAKAVFVDIPQRNVVSWNAMIAVCAQNGCCKEALQLFGQMHAESIEPNDITFISGLDACASMAAIEDGREIHATVVGKGWDSDYIVGTSLIKMYSKCGILNDAKAVFAEMPQHDVVLWSAMIAAYAQNGHSKEALKLFREMQDEGFEPDKITFICVLNACGNVIAVDEGREMHTCVVSNGWEADVIVGNALINMYGKCGSLDDARAVFAEMSDRNVVSWSAMIAVSAQNGHGKEALELFGQMEAESIRPDKVTFICVLTACSHMGLVADGRQYFASMSQDHGILPSVEHYVCMIDLLGRAGQLVKAEQLINSMPFKPVALAWLSLLSSCRIHGDLERAVRAANHVLDLDEKDASPYILLANMFAEAGRWDDVEKVRKTMIDKGVKKMSGGCFVELNNLVHELDLGDTAHLVQDPIYAELENLSRQTDVTDTKAVSMHLD